MPQNPPPPRRRNLERRTHEFLTEDEVERMIQAVKKSTGRHKERDSLIILMMYRTGTGCASPSSAPSSGHSSTSRSGYSTFSV